MKIKKGKSSNCFKKKPEAISRIFKKINYLQPIKANSSSKKTNNYNNDYSPIVNASDAMTNFFNSHHNSRNISQYNHHHHCASQYKIQNKKAVKFKSNTIADKEISLLKSRKNDNSYIEALINKSIDYTCFQNSNLLGKSIFDFSLNQSKSKKDQSKDNISNIRLAYISSDEKPSESSISFKYGTEPIAFNNNIQKENNSPKLKQESLIKNSKINESNRKDDKVINQKKQQILIMKTNFINQKSQKSNNKKNYLKNNNQYELKQINNNQRQKNNNKVINNKCGLNNFGHYNDDLNEEEDKEQIYPFALFRKDNNNNIELINDSKTNDNIESNHIHMPRTDIDLLIQQTNEKGHDIKNNSYITEKTKLDDNQKKIKDNSNEENTDNNIIENDDEDCDIDDTSIDDNQPIQTSQAYQFKPISTMNDIIVKTDIQKTETSSKYNSIVHKYLFSDEENISNSKDNVINHSHLSQIDKDLEEITTVKEKMIKIEQYYFNQIKKMQYEMNKLDNSKLKLDDSVISNQAHSFNNKEDNIKGIMNKLEMIEQSISQKENHYKSTIQSLIEELKDASKNGININKTLLKEANDFLNEEDEIIKDNPYNDKPNEATNSNILYHHSNESLATELEQFKKEEALYQFEIPPKYQMTNRVKCIKEQVIKGKFVRFYDNNVVDIIDKKKTVKRIYPDGYEIWYYNNKDIQQKSPNGKLMFYYNKNKSFEFRFLKKKFLVYKFSSGQFEKHYFDNSKSIKFADGSFRITRANGEELIQFTDGTIQLIGKNDKGISIAN